MVGGAALSCRVGPVAPGSDSPRWLSGWPVRPATYVPAEGCRTVYASWRTMAGGFSGQPARWKWMALVTDPGATLRAAGLETGRALVGRTLRVSWWVWLFPAALVTALAVRDVSELLPPGCVLLNPGSGLSGPPKLSCTESSRALFFPEVGARSVSVCLFGIEDRERLSVLPSQIPLSIASEDRAARARSSLTRANALTWSFHTMRPNGSNICAINCPEPSSHSKCTTMRVWSPEGKNR